MAVAFLPKFMALLIAIPAPVAAAYITVLIGMLFVQGMKIVIQDGVDHRKAVVVGLSFWIGTGFQNAWIFPDLLGDGFLSVLLGNGMTSGALVAVILMVLIELTSPRRRRLEVALDSDALPSLTEFLRGFASRAGWNAASTERLVLVAEETLTSLLSEDGEYPETDERDIPAVPGCHRTHRRWWSGAGVCVSIRGGEPGRPAVVPGRDAGYTGQPGDIVPPAASLRVVGAPPEVSRRGHRYGQRRWVTLALDA